MSDDIFSNSKTLAKQILHKLTDDRIDTVEKQVTILTNEIVKLKNRCCDEITGANGKEEIRHRILYTL